MSDPFVDDRHTLYVGWVLGIALRNDVPARPVLDDDGNYTARLAIELVEGLVIEVDVPPPPLDWSLVEAADD